MHSSPEQSDFKIRSSQDKFLIRKDDSKIRFQIKPRELQDARSREVHPRERQTFQLQDGMRKAVSVNGLNVGTAPICLLALELLRVLSRFLHMPPKC